METITMRIREMKGVDDETLVQLAKQNPTVLQLELLRTPKAVQSFVEDSHYQCKHLSGLDDNTLAWFAYLRPTREQMQILHTADAVHQFVQLHVNDSNAGSVNIPNGFVNPIGLLQERTLPSIPVYSFEKEEDGLFVCMCDANGLQSRGKGISKRNAKHHAAVVMLDLLSNAPPSQSSCNV